MTPEASTTSFNHTLYAILGGKWFIDPVFVQGIMPAVVGLIKGQPVSFVQRTGNQGIERMFVIDPATLVRYKIDEEEEWPSSVVGVLPISGPVTKYNGECGEPGSIALASMIMGMSKNPKISSIVLLIDTPGGEARAANGFVEAVQNAGKPVIAFIDGMAASLGVWYTSACREVYMSSADDQIGSVGSYTVLADWKTFYESTGLPIHEIYAPQSEDKNKDYRDAMAGNYDLVKEDLKRLVNSFISFVATNRPKAAANKTEWNSGKMFYAKDAIKFGLADGIMPLNKVISRAHFLSKLKNAS